MDLNLLIHFRLIALLPFLLLANSAQQLRPSFKENCADEHDKDVISCTISSVDCTTDTEALFPAISHANESAAKPLYPGEAHDLRIEPFAKALPKRGQQQEQEQSNHQLLIDISFQTPPNNSTSALKAFLLEIEGENGRKHACFLLNVSGTEWTQETITRSPRLHFSSSSLFAFAQNYNIELYSLPERSSGSGASVHSRFTTPPNPKGHTALVSSDRVSANCSKQSNHFASRWTAGFRHIYVHSAARTMQVEFIGAPPQYCFESYEVRLLDESGLELLHSGIVTAEEMERNGNLILGQFNFTDLEYDKSYIPSVIPVERAMDGRCLCPVFGTDPYDVKVVCSCVAADWRPVRMIRPDVVRLANNSSVIGILAPPPLSQGTPTEQGNTGLMWPLLLIFNAMFLLLLSLFIAAWMRCRNGALPQKGQCRRIRFVPPTKKAALDAQRTSNGYSSPSTAGSSSFAVHTNLTLGTVSAVSLNTPLISAEEQLIEGAGKNLNLLIVYSHDSEIHNRAVLLLAEYLRDTFHIKISIDQWDAKKIELNLTDWLSASVVSADKVLIVNSSGARKQYVNKINASGPPKENSGASMDHIFASHIDMALQHQSIVSARFNYSSPECPLPMLGGLLQFIIPDNMAPLVSAVFGRNMRNDVRLTENALEASLFGIRETVKEMQGATGSAKMGENLPYPGSDIAEKVGDNDGEAVATGSGIVAIDMRRGDADKLTGLPLALVEKQQSTGKLDSGIFEWSGSDEENLLTSHDGNEGSVERTKCKPPMARIELTEGVHGSNDSNFDSGMVDAEEEPEPLPRIVVA